MKKFKWTLLSAGILLSICSAFATRPPFDCSNDTQYYLSNGSYLEAGEEGIDYICQSGAGTCTYYTLDGITFLPCAQGIFDNCMGCGGPKDNRINYFAGSGTSY